MPSQENEKSSPLTQYTASQTVEINWAFPSLLTFPSLCSVICFSWFLGFVIYYRIIFEKLWFWFWFLAATVLMGHFGLSVTTYLSSCFSEWVWQSSPCTGQHLWYDWALSHGQCFKLDYVFYVSMYISHLIFISFKCFLMSTQ